MAFNDYVKTKEKNMEKNLPFPLSMALFRRRRAENSVVGPKSPVYWSKKLRLHCRVKIGKIYTLSLRMILTVN